MPQTNMMEKLDFVPYQPAEGEEYMNDAQLEHFRKILLAWKDSLIQEASRTVHHMQDDATNFPDPNDRASQEEEFTLELRTLRILWYRNWFKAFRSASNGNPMY